ncbi:MULTISPECIES: sulfatase-like hydrolase/transferase [unclassified Ruegeria]|uniref:sulfatase-like hydrolase/transferase n=1 Tax=unclassified Ruegeria TaxID=2625375 RepID=UPI001AE56CD4|nr:MULTISPECIES: sulfatase-like hydrolase/transferase [unclassified Ruegeria]
MKLNSGKASCSALALVMLSLTGAHAESGKIIHDAEHYVLEAQHGQRWADEDASLQEKLDALEAKFGTKPNIIHIMWDDTAVGEVGIPEIQAVRGFETPNMNQMADEGINFMRMYTEPACTPTRAAFQTGRYAVRSGMHTVSFPVEYSGMDAEEVTIAEVLSNVGYKTAFYGKWHLGDTEFSYAHNQGYDEAFFTPYNQVPSMWNPGAEVGNVITGLYPELYGEDKYDMDKSWQPLGQVWTLEGTKGGETLEWGPPPNIENYWDIETESQRRTLAFIDKSVEAGEPFFIAYQPILGAFFPDPRVAKRATANKNMLAEGLIAVDDFVGELVAHLEEKGIAENTLVMVMADNGPFIHYGPRGMAETLYSGGKGDFTEGGVRVPAIAKWKGVIEPDQIVGDILHVSDLFTTFARLGGAMDQIPTDRVIDGVDQTSLFLNGDGFSRRDYVMIYQGPNLAAGVKGRFKRDWKNATPGLSKNEFYDLYTDPRERTGEMIQQFHVKSMFNRQRARHEMWMQEYPNRPDATPGPALTGISNERPETRKLYTSPVETDKLPFTPQQLGNYPLPFAGSDM